MASPTRRDVHVNRPLTNVSIAYRNTMYIARMVCPFVPSNNQSDLYFAFDKSSWIRNRSGPRAPGTEAPQGDYILTTASYLCENDSFAHPVYDEVVDNADAPLQPLITGTNFVSDALELGLEIKVADLVSGSTNWTSASNPTTQWDNDTSDPWGDIDTEIDAVRKTIGRMPNMMTLSWSVWKALRNHPDFLDRVKYTRSSGKVLLSDLAEWFGVDNVYLGGGIKDTSQEGATASISDIWGDMLWVGYVSMTPQKETPSALYNFRWKDRKISVFPKDTRHMRLIEGEWSYVATITASDAGAIMSDCTSWA